MILTPPGDVAGKRLPAQDAEKIGEDFLNQLARREERVRFERANGYLVLADVVDLDPFQSATAISRFSLNPPSACS